MLFALFSDRPPFSAICAEDAVFFPVPRKERGFWILPIPSQNKLLPIGSTLFFTSCVCMYCIPHSVHSLVEEMTSVHHCNEYANSLAKVIFARSDGICHFGRATSAAQPPHLLLPFSGLVFSQSTEKQRLTLPRAKK